VLVQPPVRFAILIGDEEFDRRAKLSGEPTDHKFTEMMDEIGMGF